MANDTTPHTYTNDGMANPYTVHRILQTAASNLHTIASVVEAIDAAMTEVCPDVCDPDDHFAVALDVALNAGVTYADGIVDQPWQIRHQRAEQLHAEIRNYGQQLCPALANQVPRI